MLLHLETRFLVRWFYKLFKYVSTSDGSVNSWSLKIQAWKQHLAFHGKCFTSILLVMGQWLHVHRKFRLQNNIWCCTKWWVSEFTFLENSRSKACFTWVLHMFMPNSCISHEITLKLTNFTITKNRGNCHSQILGFKQSSKSEFSTQFTTSIYCVINLIYQNWIHIKVICFYRWCSYFWN